MADWWESKEAWESMEEADKGFTEWAHAYKREHGFFPGGGQDESLAQAISNREWSQGVQSERGSGPTQKEWVSHYYRPDEMGDTGQYWPYAVAAINKAFPETGAKTSNTPGFNDIVAQKQYDMMAPYWEQMARFGVGKAGATEGADWEAILKAEAEAQGVAEYYPILRAIVDQESGGDPTAVNATTMATGLMQIMPSDVSDRYNGMFSDRPTSAELLDPSINIREGVADFKRKLDAANGDVVTALTNYSGGYDTSKYAAPVIERAQRYGGGSPAPLPTYNEPNPDYAYMMREDTGVPVPEPEPPETFKPGPEAYEALTRAGLYKPTAEAQAALAATGAKPDTRRQVTSQDPTQQTLGAIINAYLQAAGTAIDRWNQGFDARQRGIGRVNEAIENLPPSPVDPNAPMGEPGNPEQLYREAVTDWATPKKPGPVSSTDALNRMRQSPDTATRPAPGVVWERLYLDPNASDMQRQMALRALGLRNDSDFQLTQVAANRPEVKAAKQAALDMWGQGSTRVDLPNQNLFVTPEGAEGAVTILSGAAALAGDFVLNQVPWAIAEVGKALSFTLRPEFRQWTRDLAASASGALPKVTMPTLGGVGQAALTALAQGGYLPEQILGAISIAQMTPEQLQRWSDGERLRQNILDMRAAGMEDTSEYRTALYRWQRWESSEKARYEAALGVDVSGVPGIQQLESFVGGFYSQEELAGRTSAPHTLETARQVAIDPTKRAAAWEAARAGYWTSPGLTALTYMQLLGVDTSDWEATIQRAAQYQNLGNEMLGQIPFDFYNLRVFEAPGRALYNRFMNRGKNYWIADVNKTLDAVHGDILKSGQNRSILDTIMPGATVDARRATLLNRLSVSMQMATDGAENAEDYVRLLAGYTADPVGFLGKRQLPKSQGMLEGSAILREYAGFGTKEIRVARYADELAEAVQELKNAKAAGTATDEMAENVKRLNRQLETAKKSDPAESLAKRLDRIADRGAKVHGLAGADLREYVQEEAFALLQKTIDGFIPESSANLLEKGLRPIMQNRFYQGFMKVLVTGHMGLNPGWLMRNITSDAAISLIDGYNPFRSSKSVRKFIDEFGIEPRSVSKAAPIGRQVGAGGSDIGMMGIQSHVERFGGEKVYTEAAGHTLRNLNRQAVDAYLAGAPKGMFTPAQEAYLRHIGERALSEKQFRAEMARVFSGTATVDTVLGPATWKQAYDLNIEDELKKLLEAKDDTARATIREAQNKTIDAHADNHPLKDHPRVDSPEGEAIQQIRKNPQTYDPAKMSTQELEQHVAELDELAPTTATPATTAVPAPATAAEAVPQNRLNWRSSVHAKRYRPYLDAKSKVLKATEDIANLPKSAEAERVWSNLVSAQEQADTAFAHARQVWDEAKAKLATDGRTGDVNGMFIHADNAWAKAAREGSQELNKAYQDYMNWHKSVTGKWPTTPSRTAKAAAAPTPKAGLQGAQTAAERLAAQEAEELASFEAALRANPDLSSASEDQIQRLIQEFKTGSAETKDALRQQLGTPKAATTPAAETPPQVARAGDVVEPPKPSVAGAVADETGSLDLTSIKGQAAHTKRFLDDVAERLKGRPGLSKVEPLSDAAKKYLRENYAEYMKFLNKNRLVAANYGEHARHFAYHNYDGKTSADQLASLLLMYPFWSTRTYAKLPLRIMQHPGLAAKYLRYKRWLAEENKDLPEWYRDKIVIDNTKIPWLPEELIIDLEGSINPYNTLNKEPFERPRQLEGEGMDLYLGRYMQFVEKWHFNPHLAVIAAYSASKAADGDKEAARAAMGYPAPFLRAIRDVTAWMGLNNGWGVELVPWHWTHGMFTGADEYTLNRIAGRIGELAMSGGVSPADAREAAIAFARGEAENPVIQRALKMETEQRGVFNILGFFTSFSVKGRSGYDRELSKFYADMANLYANAANMTDDEFRQALSDFYGDPAHYHYRVADIARSEVDDAETSYIRDIWWNSIPPGQTDVAIAKYGDEETGRILERMLDRDGPGIAGLSVEERTRVTMFMAALSSKYPPPDQEMFEEWQAVKDAYNKFEAATEEKFGSPKAISATDALNMMRQGQGQPAQSEFDRIMEAYWAADPDTKKAMRNQYPVIDQYFDWKTDYMENDPLLMWYYGAPPRDQATDNLWNLYNAYTDSGMAQTKVDLAEDLDAMGADMGIPGCELDGEGEGCFSRFFRNQDTRDYEKLPNELLLAWTLYIASEAAKRGVDPNVYRTQEGEAAGTQALAPEPSGGDPAIVTSPWQMGESEPARTGLPGTEYEQTYGTGAPGLQVPTDVPGKAVVSASPDGLGTSVGGLDVAADAPGPSAGGSGGKPVVAGDGSAELAPTAPATGEKSFWDFDFTEEQFERAAPEMDALRSERNRLYKMCENGVEQACNQLKDDRFNVFSTPEWLFYYEQIAPGWRLQDSGFYDDPTISQWLDPATREGISAEEALKRMQQLKAALPDLSFGDPKEYTQARDEQEQWKETSANLMPGTMGYRQAQAKYAEEHPVWAKYYLRPKTAASLAEYAARGWTYAPRSGGDGSSDGGGTSGGSGYRYTGPWFSPDTFRGAGTSRRPAVQDSDLWQRVVMAALSRTKQ